MEVLHELVKKAALLAKGVNLCCHHLRSHTNQQGGLRQYFANENQLLTFDLLEKTFASIGTVEEFLQEQIRDGSSATPGLKKALTELLK